jgi:hypothetical protein
LIQKFAAVLATKDRGKQETTSTGKLLGWERTLTEMQNMAIRRQSQKI